MEILDVSLTLPFHHPNNIVACFLNIAHKSTMNPIYVNIYIYVCSRNKLAYLGL